jgi:hypothetical protein
MNTVDATKRPGRQRVRLRAQRPQVRVPPGVPHFREIKSLPARVHSRACELDPVGNGRWVSCPVRGQWAPGARPGRAPTGRPQPASRVPPSAIPGRGVGPRIAQPPDPARDDGTGPGRSRGRGLRPRPSVEAPGDRQSQRVNRAGSASADLGRSDGTTHWPSPLLDGLTRERTEATGYSSSSIAAVMRAIDTTASSYATRTVLPGTSTATDSTPASGSSAPLIARSQCAQEMSGTDRVLFVIVLLLVVLSCSGYSTRTTKSAVTTWLSAVWNWPQTL